jgi:hypothetical protein
MNRKTFVTTLGAAGFGLGLTAARDGGALAQEEPTPAGDVVRADIDPDEMRTQFYSEFTAALADELGIANADEVDAAIRVAMMAVIDARADDGDLTYGQAEALKTLVATSDVPLSPGPILTPPRGTVFRGPHGPEEGRGRMAPGIGARSTSHARLDDDRRGDDQDGTSERSSRVAEDDGETNDEDDASS